MATDCAKTGSTTLLIKWVFISKVALGKTELVPSKIYAVAFNVANEIPPPPCESTYNLVAASVFKVGVARLVIFYELRLTDVVGAVIALRAVVFK